MWLWRLTSPQTCCQYSEDPGKLTVQFHLKCQQVPREPVFQFRFKGEKEIMSHLEGRQAEDIPSYLGRGCVWGVSLSVLFRILNLITVVVVV